MKKIAIIAMVLISGVIGALIITGRNSSAAPAVFSQKNQDNIVPNQYIVVLKQETVTRAAADKNAANRVVAVNRTASAINTAVADIAVKNNLVVGQTYHYAIAGFSTTIPSNKLNAVKNDHRVAFVSPVRRYQITMFGSASLVTISSDSQKLPTGVDRINAENKVNKGRGIDVAVIDSGIDNTHPDLAANVAGQINCASDGSSGYDDQYGHGTHVAGTIAALDNNIGVVGVAPEARLWAVRVLNAGGRGDDPNIICGVDFVTEHAPANGGPIKVANMSLGGPGPGKSDNNCGRSDGDALHLAICNSRDAGVTYVVAAGNSYDDATRYNPASYDDTVITVSALNDSDGKPGGLGPPTSRGNDDAFASFSNYGIPPVDVGAPGVDILSTWKGGEYRKSDGTSMASPHVAGAAALYLAAHPGASWQQVRDYLVANGEKPPH